MTKIENKKIQNEILELLKNKRECALGYLVQQLNYSYDQILHNVLELKHNGVLFKHEGNKGYYSIQRS